MFLSEVAFFVQKQPVFFGYKYPMRKGIGTSKTDVRVNYLQNSVRISKTTKPISIRKTNTLKRLREIVGTYHTVHMKAFCGKTPCFLNTYIYI